jgi:N-methylhydantoinase B
MPGESIHIHTAGGAGYGLPEERDPASRERDVALGYVTEDGDAGMSA